MLSCVGASATLESRITGEDTFFSLHSILAQCLSASDISDFQDSGLNYGVPNIQVAAAATER